MLLPRRGLISTLIIAWILLFHYESLRATYLNPLFHRQLPKVPLLFPPAGWIMFYQVDARYGFAEVRGVRNDALEPIDPHRIFRTPAVGYDNIHRNVLVGVLDREHAADFCRYLHRKFPEYDGFLVLYGEYSDLTNRPDDSPRYGLAYRCR